MSARRTAIVMLMLVFIFLIGILMLHGQEPIDPREAPPKPPPDRPALSTPVSYDKVKYSNCLVTGPHEVVEERLDAKTGKYKTVRSYTYFELTLSMRDKKGKVIWQFGPVRLDTRASALRDCGEWLETTDRVMRKLKQR